MPSITIVFTSRNLQLADELSLEKWLLGRQKSHNSSPFSKSRPYHVLRVGFPVEKFEPPCMGYIYFLDRSFKLPSRLHALSLGVMTTLGRLGSWA